MPKNNTDKTKTAQTNRKVVSDFVSGSADGKGVAWVNGVFAGDKTLREAAKKNADNHIRILPHPHSPELLTSSDDNAVGASIAILGAHPRMVIVEAPEEVWDIFPEQETNLTSLVESIEHLYEEAEALQSELNSGAYIVGKWKVESFYVEVQNIYLNSVNIEVQVFSETSDYSYDTGLNLIEDIIYKAAASKEHVGSLFIEFFSPTGDVLHTN